MEQPKKQGKYSKKIRNLHVFLISSHEVVEVRQGLDADFRDASRYRGLFMLSHYQEQAFYLWAVALALATAVTVRSIMHSPESVLTEWWLVAASMVCCLLQFYIGRRIGGRYNDTVSAGQSLGQKNTVLAIRMGFTFFTPITSVVGGFYGIWHNLINSWQLYRHKQAIESRGTGRP